MSIWENIRGFQEFSMCDWPGKVAAVIFLGGCNFRCPTCHNWTLATNSGTLDRIPRHRIMDYLEASKQWLDGVVITGGEPTITPGLSILLKEVKALGLPANINTNGSHPEVIGDLLKDELVDMVSVDVKGPWDKYPELTRRSKLATARAEADLSLIFEFAKLYPGKFYFRTTAVPMLTDEDLAICRSYLPTGHELHIQEYREPDHLKDEETVNSEFGMVLVIDKKTNKDVLELPAFKATLALRDMGVSDPISAILNWGTPEFTIINNL
ncbi:anaerobic ribonucleoside-triphosphate reductase activating protein [Pseudodesulfovibrio pelocollis]|uniref:anaerobic ribonucleoside-triphosphate reductase activating protein n=1 Tax=Pseudodesulfovibrio pelocollis TaxID=3051432 RepID=UPI00255AB54D|nr:anaerobic ribonucleoside-triphosphate reductase activating protein [Pseudodesulfovibrio sp. SB368]